MKYTKLLKVLVSCTDLSFFTRTITDFLGMSYAAIPFHGSFAPDYHSTGSSSTRFLRSAEFADFVIFYGPDEFRTHKLVLCTGSHYFRKLCTGPFREATDNVVRLDDQQPLMIVLMLQYLYCGEYDIVNLSAGLTSILDKALLQIILDSEILAQDFDFEVHAQVYAMADRFETPALKAIGATNFASELRSKNFSIADLVSAIEFVYTTTPENDYGLRKWVVYRAQQFERELVRYEGFENALKDHANFAWDFATKCTRANYLCCCHCKDIIDLVECRCRFQGMCGDPVCATEAPAALRCTICEFWGMLRREMPRLEENITLGELGHTDEPDAPIRRTPKKRRFGLEVAVHA